MKTMNSGLTAENASENQDEESIGEVSLDEIQDGKNDDNIEDHQQSPEYNNQQLPNSKAIGHPIQELLNNKSPNK